jgi:3-deoxy-manno-octulosonate cytidylyltransferase (CMP-KDO synthetase)
LIVNVQGDEPLIQPQMIDQAVAPLLADSSIEMGTLASKIDAVEDFYSPNVVKVVRDLQNFALYFSRAPIPWPRDMQREQIEQQLAELGILRHIGLYVYRRQLLLDYPTWPKTPLEALENLEQLRALERGVKLYVGETQFSCHGVDTPADIERVEALLSEEKS